MASGSIARHFIDRIGKNRVAHNHYFVTCSKAGSTPEKMGKDITLIDADPTSFFKLSKIMSERKFSNIFIVMDEKEEAHYVLKNIALIDTKIRIVLVNQWDDDEIGKALENITILHTDTLLTAHLYDQLPNVPLVAQNVGQGRGEIMEVHVPFGSSYAYRHVGSIVQRKWKIVALYRDDKQILPTNATMIKPNDTLLIVGKPIVLEGIYKTINKRMGLFPEPFGKDIYLLLDFRYDKAEALRYIEEGMYLLEKLEEKSFFIRIIYPNDFDLLNKIKGYESESVNIVIHYDEDEIKQLIEFDIHEYNIGLLLSSIATFEADGLKERLYDLRKLVYLFGGESLVDIKNAMILIDENEKMESISSTAFEISEALNMLLTLADFDPEGDFGSKERVIEHFETLAHIFDMEINIEQKIANPIRELSAMKDILQIAPFEGYLDSFGLRRFISSKIKDFILTSNKHPKLLVPFATTEG